ncbi:MAG: hypothetical protein ACK5XV_12470 [Flavobacteriales bacterium]
MPVCVCSASLFPFDFPEEIWAIPPFPNIDPRLYSRISIPIYSDCIIGGSGYTSHSRITFLLWIL